MYVKNAGLFAVFVSFSAEVGTYCIEFILVRVTVSYVRKKQGSKYLISSLKQQCKNMFSMSL